MFTRPTTYEHLKIIEELLEFAGLEREDARRVAADVMLDCPTAKAIFRAGQLFDRRLEWH